MINQTTAKLGIDGPSYVRTARAVWAATGGTRPATSLLVIVLIGGIDLAWDGYAGLSFAGWQTQLLSVLFLLFVSLVYRTVRPVPGLAELPLYAALWVAFACLVDKI